MAGGIIFLLSWDPHTLIQFTTVNVMFLPVIVKEGAGNSFVQFVGTLHT